MPWLPELFSAPVLERAREKRELERLDAVPYYVGLMSGEHEALRSDGRLMELRIYHSIWALTGHHLHRPPLLQRDPDLRAEGVVAEYQRALAACDVDAIMATFEPNGYAREPTGREFIHRGRDALRAFYERLFRTAAASRLNTVRWFTTGARARSSTTSSAGAGPRLLRKRGLPSKSKAPATNSVPPASMTTSIPRFRLRPADRHRSADQLRERPDPPAFRASIAFISPV